MSTLKISVGDADHVQGDAHALVTLVEYGDYQCPHCKAVHPVVKHLQKHFGKKLRFVFRNFPLTQIHPNAEPAAEAAEYAGSQGKFWEFHSGLFDHQDSLGDELYEELATKSGLDPADLHQALTQNTFAARVRSDFTGGVRSGVNGTPTFFINGERHDGLADTDTLTQAIEAVLDRAS